jgi:5-methylcytosine-specific restriction endonuclease McrA
VTGRSRGPLSWSTLSAIVTATGAACAYCGTREDLVAHHKVPRRLGGLDLLENLEPVCRSCHPSVESEARAEAELTWKRPERPEPARPRRSPRLRRPY